MSFVVHALFVLAVQASDSSAPEPRPALVRPLASSQSDVCASIAEVAEDLFLTGYTTDARGSADALVLRVGADGEVRWRQTIAGGGDAALWAVRALADGGALAAGWAKSARGDRDVLLVRLAGNGAVLWQRLFAGEGDERLWSLDLVEGGALAAGESAAGGRSTGLVLRATLEGAEAWRRTPGVAESERVFAVCALAEGAYVLGGMAGSGPRESAGYDARVACYDAGGALRWSRTLRGADFDVAHDLRALEDGRVAVLGYSFVGPARAADPFLALLTPAGEVEWSRAHPGDDDERAVSLELLAGGGFATAGYARPRDGDVDLVVRTFDASGAALWRGRFGGAGDELGRALVQGKGGALVVVGHSRSYGALERVLLVRIEGIDA